MIVLKAEFARFQCFALLIGLSLLTSCEEPVLLTEVHAEATLHQSDFPGRGLKAIPACPEPVSGFHDSLFIVPFNPVWKCTGPCSNLKPYDDSWQWPSYDEPFKLRTLRYGLDDME